VVTEEGRVSREIRDNGASAAEGISGIAAFAHCHATKTPLFISKLWVRARLTSYAEHSSSKSVIMLEEEVIEDREGKTRGGKILDKVGRDGLLGWSGCA
jgi:hypothetical protein